MGTGIEVTPEILDRICERLEKGEGLKAICRDADMPAHRTLYDLRERDSAVKKRLQDARNIGTEGFMEETVEIADEAFTKDSNGKIDPGDVQARKLKIWARHEYVKKFNPEMFGDKVKQEVSGPNGGPVQLGYVVVPAKS